MFGFRLRASHPLWSAFPHASPNLPTAISGSYNPREQAPGFGLFRFRSPLLTESLSFSIPLVTEMFHFTRSRAHCAMYSHSGDWILIQPGYPIRKSTGHSVFAALRGLSQLITSFIACWHQGIHHVLLVAFFILILLKFLLGGHRWLSPRSPRRLSFVNYLEVVIFFPNMRMSKNHAHGRSRGTLSNPNILPFSIGKIQNAQTTEVVGLIGLEPMTLRLSSACSNQLSYRPEGKCSMASALFSGLKTEN